MSTVQDQVTPLPERVVAVGTSAGGLHALTALLSRLPSRFAFPVLVVQHLAKDHRSHLAQLLQPCTGLDVKEAREGDSVRGGHVYVAPPNRHMEVSEIGTIQIKDNPPVSFSRPSVDVLFASVAHAFGNRSIAVVLTGAGSDGARGARAVHDAGGLVVAQDRTSSESFGMPHAAIASGVVDRVLPLTEIGSFLLEIADTETAS